MIKRYIFDHNVDDTIDPMCSANYGVEDVTSLFAVLPTLWAY